MLWYDLFLWDTIQYHIIIYNNVLFFVWHKFLHHQRTFNIWFVHINCCILCVTQHTYKKSTLFFVALSTSTSYYLLVTAIIYNIFYMQVNISKHWAHFEFRISHLARLRFTNAILSTIFSVFILNFY